MKSNISSIHVFTDALMLQCAPWRLRTVSGGEGGEHNGLTLSGNVTIKRQMCEGLE